MFRKPVKEVSPSTRLVQQLYSFGLEEPSSSSSSSFSDSTAPPIASTSTLPPPITQSLADLSLGTPTTSKNGSVEQPKVNQSLRKLLKSTEHTLKVPLSTEDGGEEEERVLTSWKMADYAYKRDPCPFPTRARGLFTEKVRGTEGGEEEYRIVARGYDKFFNVNEVSWTQWEKIPEYSSGPYELTTKSNGCIILIAALTPTHLIVTSKHSIGKNSNLSTEGSVSHSERGEYWLERHLESVGKTKRDLAKELWEQNLTAVAELCDDSFEEHVLPYPTDQTGLHLHGLNRNVPLLETLPSSLVSQFATTFGMIKTPYFTFPSVIAVKTYCETVQQSGGVEFVAGSGVITPVEGFVVRGKKKGGGNGEAFFWKVKYDEPYLMFREWRELTRKCLTAYPDHLDQVDPKKVKNSDSRLYLWWVKREIERDVAKFESWKFGKGMIKTREDFLKWEKTPEGREARRELGEIVELDEAEKKGRKFDKTLIVPIAIQGCGKTALGLELSKLFGFGHVQSDDFLVKKPTPHFLKKIKELLKTHSVVFADKNNHQIKHRQDLITLVHSLSSLYRIRLIALVYPIDSPSLPRDKFHSLMSSRIVSRGENHQSLRAGTEHEAAIWQFLGQHEEFDPVSNATSDGKFDFVVEIKPEATREEALEYLVKELEKVQGMGIEDPGEEKRREAIEWAKGYKVEKKKEVGESTGSAIKKRSPPKNVKPRYYGLSVDVDLKELVEKHLPKPREGETTTPTTLWTELVKSHRVETSPHVTLVHQLELQSPDPVFQSAKQSLWNKYERLVQLASSSSESATEDDRKKKLLEVEVTLGPKLVWNDRVMSIQVSSLRQLHPSTKSDNDKEEEDLEDESISLVDDRSSHITIGTRSSDIRPVEGKFLMEKALLEGGAKEGIEEIEIGEVKVKARLAGLS
ncbi:tRNA ligase [Sporobolomyces salmoneus]|uniref:tRNA ligase n=1 Tax=Sporobolomyces salmoneus TaxID=183962 RepID=UPI0031775B5E